MAHSGPFATIADQVKRQRETTLATEKASQQQHATDLRELAAVLHALVRRAQSIPGTYRVWAHLEDSAAQAEMLAKEWSEKGA